MDEEDLADAEEARQLSTSQAFAGFGSSTDGQAHNGSLIGLFKSEGDTMGLKLLRRMGWKDGQGIGPKVRRTARMETNISVKPDDATYLFAPDDSSMIRFVRKTDRMGLGYQGEAKLTKSRVETDSNGEDEDELLGPTKLSNLGSKLRSKRKVQRGGMGVGILNDNGSDGEEDAYEMGPKIRYNRVIGGDKKKKSKANPALGSGPTFLPKGARASGSLRRCHDGRLPLDGFVLARVVEDLTTLLSKYAPLAVPEGWASEKIQSDDLEVSATYQSAADAAKESKLDPKARAAILGEKALPGKSVFDYLSSSARDKLATASGKGNLPPGLGEVPAEYALSLEEKLKALWDQVPKVDRDTAVAAIARGSSGPYADDDGKRNRYRAYLEHGANPDRPLPAKPTRMTDDDYLREMNEFFNCARIFKPMTGFMASRFTTAKTTQPATIDNSKARELVTHPEPKLSDPAEDAARIGMYGRLTRSVRDFYPTRLLCKRFNVKPPAHSQPDGNTDSSNSSGTADAAQETNTLLLTLGSATEHMTTQQSTGEEMKPVPAKVDPEKNDAVEASTASADLLKAVFGDSDEDED